MQERDENRIIHDLERELGLAPEAKPQWGYDLDRAFFPEEAPTKDQRKFAGWCLRNLSFFLAGYELAARRGSVPPLTASHVQGFYLQEREERRYRWGATFADFTLAHVLGSAKRRIAWLEELKRFEETYLYDGMLQRFRLACTILERTLGHDSPSSQGP